MICSLSSSILKLSFSGSYVVIITTAEVFSSKLILPPSNVGASLIGEIIIDTIPSSESWFSSLALKEKESTPK